MPPNKEGTFGQMVRHSLQGIHAHNQSYLRRAKSRATLLTLTCLLSVGLAACSRPTGDFDRAKPNIVYDRVAEDAGRLYRYTVGETVSNLNYTDNELQMRDLGWGLVVPPAAEDWIGASKAQLKRQSLLKDPYAELNPSSYYVHLRSDKYRSSETRYARIIHDLETDRKLLPPFCKIASKVLASDKERLGALKRQRDVNEQFATGVIARTHENKAFVDWVVKATGQRLQAYKIAINALEVETPSHGKIWDANQAYERLNRDYARLPELCYGRIDQKAAPSVKPSRILQGWGLERTPDQK